MQELYSFPLETKNGTVTINLGQCYRPNTLTRKIYHFKSVRGYAIWVMTVAHGVRLSFEELEEAIETAMKMVGAELEVA